MSFKRLDPEDISISAESVTAPVWTGNVTTLTSFFTSSTQANGTTGDFYLNVYQTGSTEDTAAIQFAVAFCDKYGSGSVDFTPGVSGFSPSRANYGTYKNQVLGDEVGELKFGANEVTSSYFYAINFERSRFKEKLLPGTLELKLKNGATTLTLTEIIPQTVTYTDAGRKYELKSNAAEEGSNLFLNSGSYGHSYPDIGLIILNGQALDAPTSAGGLALATGPYNSNRLKANTDTSGSQALYDAIVDAASFKQNAEETLSSNYIFVRARNQDFNYSSNPSYISASGELTHTLMIEDPRSYITSVGLYNDNNDLLAVSKLSRPLLKDSRREALLRIKLDF